MKNMKFLVALLMGLALTGCGKADESVAAHTEPVAAAPAVAPAAESSNGDHVKIIDVRKEGDCENQTLMEYLDQKENFRFTRCGYFGQIGDTFWYKE